eukprot:GHRQ01029590.1.p1 GENE.GHRQ01029590.1~~GHRQ01029590.1.p1  ORF type:complete len:124 (+),score=22.63 GHRQ01029590.1:258-629(+)
MLRYNQRQLQQSRCPWRLRLGCPAAGVTTPSSALPKNPCHVDARCSAAALLWLTLLSAHPACVADGSSHALRLLQVELDPLQPRQLLRHQQPKLQRDVGVGLCCVHVARAGTHFEASCQELPA